MSKLNQTKIPLGFSVNNWKLVREHDRLARTSKDIIWVEFNSEGRFKSKHDGPAVNRSLIMSPFNEFFTWQTTPITK